MPRKENTAVAASFSQKTELHGGFAKPKRRLNLVAFRGGHACGHIFVRTAEGVCVTAAAEDGRTFSGEEYNGENVVLYAEKGICHRAQLASQRAADRGVYRCAAAP